MTCEMNEPNKIKIIANEPYFHAYYKSFCVLSIVVIGIISVIVWFMLLGFVSEVNLLKFWRPELVIFAYSIVSTIVNVIEIHPITRAHTL